MNPKNPSNPTKINHNKTLPWEQKKDIPDDNKVVKNLFTNHNDDEYEDSDHWGHWNKPTNTQSYGSSKFSDPDSIDPDTLDDDEWLEWMKAYNNKHSKELKKYDDIDDGWGDDSKWGGDWWKNWKPVDTGPVLDSKKRHDPEEPAKEEPYYPYGKDYADKRYGANQKWKPYTPHKPYIDAITFNNRQGTLYMTAAPGTTLKTWKSFDEELGEFEKHNIKTIVCLLPKEDLIKNYSDDQILFNEYRAKGFNVIHFPITDFGVPKIDRKFTDVLRRVSELLKTQNVLVHCRAGLGRTGLFVASLLVMSGIPADRAISFVRKKRPGTVETKEQERFVHLLQQKMKPRRNN